jgi:hypothetical protein
VKIHPGHKPMRRVSLYCLSALTVGLVAAACGDGGGTPVGGPYGGTGKYVGPDKGNEGTEGTEGSGGSGGVAGSGGTGGTAGVASSGGTSGSGGASGTGGASGAGGAEGYGGASGTGGTSGTGTPPDAGPPPPVDSGPPATTWTDCWTKFLAPSAPSDSNCTGSCHRHTFEGAGTATGTYSWLQGRGYIDGTTSPPLISSAQSCFSWLGGNMPQGGTYSLPAAVTCFNAWAASGGKND